MSCYEWKITSDMHALSIQMSGICHGRNKNLVGLTIILKETQNHGVSTRTDSIWISTDLIKFEFLLGQWGRRHEICFLE